MSRNPSGTPVGLVSSARQIVDVAARYAAKVLAESA